MKMVIKNIRMFVVPFNTVSGKTRQISAGIFYTLLIIYYTVSTPVYSCNGYTAHRVKGNGKAKPFFIFATIGQDLSVMPFTEKICSRVKHSTPSTTSEARHALVQYFTENYPPVKRLKIKDHKRFFVARARYGQRVLYAKAYSLERLTEYFRQEFEVKVFGKEVCHA